MQMHDDAVLANVDLGMGNSGAVCWWNSEVGGCAVFLVLA